MNELGIRDERGEPVADVELVAGDVGEGIGHRPADPWNRGQAVELSDGIAWRKREGDTWDSPAGGRYVVARNGDDEGWDVVV